MATAMMMAGMNRMNKNFQKINVVGLLKSRPGRPPASKPL